MSNLNLYKIFRDEFYENQKQADKKDFNAEKLKELKDKERQLLEKKSEV